MASEAGYVDGQQSALRNIMGHPDVEAFLYDLQLSDDEEDDDKVRGNVLWLCGAGRGRTAPGQRLTVPRVLGPCSAGQRVWNQDA